MTAEFIVTEGISFISVDTPKEAMDIQKMCRGCYFRGGLCNEMSVDLRHAAIITEGVLEDEINDLKNTAPCLD